MQSTLFNLAERQTQERYTLQSPQLLRVALQGHDDVLAREGSVVAHQGLIEFDGEIHTMGQQAAVAYPGDELDLMRCHGQGTVYFANLAQHVHLVDVEQDGLTVDSDYVLAMDSALHHEVVSVDTRYGITGSGKRQIVISGRGQVALMTSGQPLMLPVTPDRYVSADADAVVAWSSGLRVRVQEQTHSAGVWRRRGNTGEGWEFGFTGQGFALVQPSEMLPPGGAMTEQGPSAQYGTGQHGAHGQNQGNVWS